MDDVEKPQTNNLPKGDRKSNVSYGPSILLAYL
jgi:hypothetical protein